MKEKCKNLQLKNGLNMLKKIYKALFVFLAVSVSYVISIHMPLKFIDTFAVMFAAGCLGFTAKHVMEKK